VDDRAVSELRQLAARDAELSARAGELRNRDAEVGAIRARVEQVEAFLVAFPEEERRREAELGTALADLEARRTELERAEQEVARADDPEARAHAESARARAADHVAVAQARIDRAKAALSELRHGAERAPAELAELFDRAAGTDGVTLPQDEQSLVDWASHARAELFVALGELDTQRELVIREANELATMLVGEPTYGTTPAQAVARVEAHWASSPGHVSESR
jgi:DNA repair exonuclease SbcCD ATPase subunit